MKIIDILKQDDQSVSFEYYPPKSRDRWMEFYEKIQRMKALRPKFVDITWGTGDPTSRATLEIASRIQGYNDGIETMMHVTCTHRERGALLDLLAQVRDETSIRNIMALRGNRLPEGPWRPCAGGFQSACELVRGIRDAFGDVFGISVAGYPEGHREDGLPPDPEFQKTRAFGQQILYLRKKVEAGADFIVTQLCFDFDKLSVFRERCERDGIHCPIVVGILPICNRHTWERIAAFSASIPEALRARFERAVSPDGEGVEAFGVALLCEQIVKLRALGFPYIHLYTLNHEKMIARALGRFDGGVWNAQRSLPPLGGIF